ncbi:hypothetical protein [Chitinophaga qingshengii]|uniref:Uncharacterized protein n=1 Tax=Chitinophaga qingshengii TaxID=1569794 RepID=A0ABR7TV33_9BACT|nr:hypothetical protein [Chitinophaga qingshengii]MBC9934292.1 hypothetical protein [Chitinophaga qingshengii]
MNYNPAAMRSEMQDTQQRFVTFVDKLEIKLKEFAEASLPELTEMNDNDEDAYKQTYHRMKSAVLGQVDSIRKKAYDVLEEKVMLYQVPWEDAALRQQFMDMRNTCQERYTQLEDLIQYYREKIEETFSEDLEAKYQYILDEYERIKDKFLCTQCGGGLTIDKIYFTTTYIACPFCQTQNTFEPSSQAKSLEHLGRSLAEKRTAHLLKASHHNGQLEEDAFRKKHRLEMDMAFEQNSREKTRLAAELANAVQHWENTRNETIRLYKNYLRAMFDEWNNINPGLTAEHERFHERMLQDYLDSKKNN